MGHRDRAEDVAQFVPATRARRRRLRHAGCLRRQVDQRVQSGSQRGRDGARHQPEKTKHRRAIDGVTARASVDARRPTSDGIGQMVRIGQRVDRPRPITRQRTGDRVSMPAARRVGPARDRAAAPRGHHRMVKGLHQIGGQAAGDGQHRGVIHDTTPVSTPDGQLRPPLTDTRRRPAAGPVRRVSGPKMSYAPAGPATSAAPR